MENRLASEHPNLIPYRRGFVLLDFDEEAQRAFGAYRLLVGTIPVLMPVIYRKGELASLDVLIVRDLKLYAPAIDGWINLIATFGAQELGELLPAKERSHGRTPSQVMLQLKDFPYMVRTAKSQLSPAEYETLMSGLREPDGDAAWNALTANLHRDWLLHDAHAAATW